MSPVQRSTRPIRWFAGSVVVTVAVGVSLLAFSPAASSRPEQEPSEQQLVRNGYVKSQLDGWTVWQKPAAGTAESTPTP